MLSNCLTLIDLKRVLFPLTSGLFGPWFHLCWEGHIWWAVPPLSALFEGPFCCLLDQLPEGAVTTRRTSFIESLDHSGSAYPV